MTGWLWRGGTMTGWLPPRGGTMTGWLPPRPSGDPSLRSGGQALGEGGWGGEGQLCCATLRLRSGHAFFRLAYLCSRF